MTRVIAVTPLEKQRDANKNRSHNPKTNEIKLQSFFSIKLTAFQPSGRAET
jgi:hypothetical protein